MGLPPRMGGEEGGQINGINAITPSQCVPGLGCGGPRVSQGWNGPGGYVLWLGYSVLGLGVVVPRVSQGREAVVLLYLLRLG